jgi:hypothetical protein
MRSAAALSQLEPFHDVVRHDPHGHAGISCRPVVVAREAFHLQAIVRRITNELVRPGAHRMQAQLAARAVRHDFHHQIDEEGAGWLLQDELNRVGIDRRHRHQIQVAPAIRRGHSGIENAREGVDHILRRELVPVVETHALAEVHDVR